MSEAVLRLFKEQYVASGPSPYKVTVLPSLPLDAGAYSEFPDRVLEVKARRKLSAADQVVSVTDDAPHAGFWRKCLWIGAVCVTLTIILAGLVIGYLNPGPITGVILPIGVTLWWLLYKLADRFDRPA